MTKIGYCRVSTIDQTGNLQKDALTRAGCEQIHEDKISGAKTKRDALNACMASLKAGDTLVVWKLDRLGRSLPHLLRLMEEFRSRGVVFESLTERIDTSTPSGEFLFHLLASLAQFERALIRERVMAGLATARAGGTKLGRRQIILDADIETILNMDKDGVSQTEISKHVGISQSSVSRILSQRRGGVG